jgi:transcription elongation factor GreA
MLNNTSNNNSVTKEGLESLKKEYSLKLKERDRISIEINLARAEGDLKENEAYHAGLLARDINESRISEIEAILENYTIVEVKQNDIVQIGSTVTVKVNDIEKIFKIVGVNEADPVDGKISGNSPLGSALLGKKAGESLDLKIDESSVKYDIMKVVN